MKHPSVRAFFAYWDRKRGFAAAPTRADFAPDAVRHLLGDAFVVAGHPAAAGYPVRVAGTRLCALFGHDIKGRSFPGLFTPASQPDCEAMLAAALEDTLATVAGASAILPGRTIHLELLLLPFAAQPHAPPTLTGLLAPLDGGGALAAVPPLHHLTLTTWRHLHRPERLRPHAMRRREIVRGMTLYEGVRDLHGAPGPV